MNYDCNVRSRSTILQARESGLLVSHRSNCRTYSLLSGARDGGAKQLLETRLAAHQAHRHYCSGCAFGVAPDRCAFEVASDQSGRLLRSLAGSDALATCIRGQEASAATRREVIGTSRVFMRTAVRCRLPFWEQRTFMQARSRLVRQSSRLGAATRT
jgi:hypothetical protein